MANILIVYYSRKGQNYWNGSIKNITKGNTERVAEFIQDAVGGELFEIDTVNPYDEDYYVCIEEAKKELHEGTRPELKKYLDNLDDFDTEVVCWVEVTDVPERFVEEAKKIDGGNYIAMDLAFAYSMTGIAGSIML